MEKGSVNGEGKIDGEMKCIYIFSFTTIAIFIYLQDQLMQLILSKDLMQQYLTKSLTECNNNKDAGIRQVFKNISTLKEQSQKIYHKQLE